MKVLIVSGSPAYRKMWEKLGATITDNIQEAELIQFTGGEDVSPFLYGETKHRTTGSNAGRDIYEAGIFAIASRIEIPMAGICRGGQFLNVMSGGRMYQDVDGHTIYGTHACTDVTTGEIHQVTSTHHQMMVPSSRGVLLAEAAQASRLETDSRVYNLLAKGGDTEAVFYPHTNCLCFQPHPEFNNADSTLKYYVELLNRCFDLRLEG